MLQHSGEGAAVFCGTAALAWWLLAREGMLLLLAASFPMVSPLGVIIAFFTGFSISSGGGRLCTEDVVTPAWIISKAQWLRSETSPLLSLTQQLMSQDYFRSPSDTSSTLGRYSCSCGQDCTLGVLTFPLNAAELRSLGHRAEMEYPSADICLLDKRTVSHLSDAED